jgi:predicted ATPase
MFLDDIQWADEGSTQLIQMFLRDDSELDNVMFVMAYRDEEAAHVFESGMLDAAQDPTDIPVSNLNADAVHEMVTSIMGSSTDEIRQLSDLVTKRSSGNPLHVTMFMETIQQEGLLAYDKTAKSWIFDVLEMQSEIMVSESLADLLTRKIERLSHNLAGTLKVASLLGYHFSESILLKVLACMALGESSVMLSLTEAVREGFIEKADDTRYHFSHDKVQSAFKSLIDESEGAQLHLLIGEAYLSDYNHGIGRSNIYRSAVHLSRAPDFLSDHQQRVRLARINLEAAKYCTEISAFEQAVAALQTGINALGPIGKWSDEHFALTFEMMETQARMQLVVGDFEACKATILEASCHARTAEMKMKLLAIDVEVRTMAGNEVDDVIATANRGLRALGFKMPRKAKLRHIAAKLAKVKFMLRRKTNEDLLNLPLTQDLVDANVVKLLIDLGSVCFMKNELEMGAFSVLIAVELTLKNGLSQHSPCAFVIYGVLEAAIGNIDRGYRFGKLALEMLHRRHSREGEGPTAGYANGSLFFWKEPLDQLVTPLREAANSAFQYGDILYATYCMLLSHGMQLSIGEHLADVELAMRATYGRVYDLGQDGLLRWLQPLLQYVINMQADVTNWGHIAVLTGEIMNEEAYLNDVVEKEHHQIFYLVCSMWKANLAMYFGQFSLADSIWKSCRVYGLDDLQHSWSGPDVYFNQALMKYGLFELTGEDDNFGDVAKADGCCSDGMLLDA